VNKLTSCDGNIQQNSIQQWKEINHQYCHNMGEPKNIMLIKENSYKRLPVVYLY
jgi:hypothetical protein